MVVYCSFFPYAWNWFLHATTGDVGFGFPSRELSIRLVKYDQISFRRCIKKIPYKFASEILSTKYKELRVPALFQKKIAPLFGDRFSQKTRLETAGNFVRCQDETGEIAPSNYEAIFRCHS